MADERPAWARRMLNERQARGWSQADAIKAMRAHAPADPRTHAQALLPSTSSLLRQYKRWEAGEVEPDRGKARFLGDRLRVYPGGARLPCIRQLTTASA